MEPNKLKKAKLEHITAKMRAKRAWTTNYYREWTRSLFNGNHFSSKKVYYIPPPLTVHFPMTRSVRYQPIFNGLKFMLHRALELNNVVITTVIEMVEMVEILDGRVCNRSVERKVCLLHLVIVKYGVISLVLCISTLLRLVTILTLLMKYFVIFHANLCNKSYIFVDK